MKKAIAEARKLYTKKLESGKNLLEHTTYENISMWWVANSMFRVFLNKALSDNIGNTTYRKKFTIFYKSFGIYLGFIYDFSLKILLSILIKMGPQKRHNNKTKTKKIIVHTTPMHWMEIKDYKTNKMKKTDSFYDTILESLSTLYMLTGVYTIDLTPIKGLKIFIDKTKNWYIPYKPLNLYWSFGVWKKRIKAFRYFSALWKNIKNDKIFKEMCIIDGKDLYSQIKDELDFYFFFVYPHAIGYIEMGRIMIRKEKSVLIILQDEYEWKEKSYLVIAAKLENIFTLAFQHGIISPYHEGYLYVKNEISTSSFIEPLYNQIPSVTAVYGKYYKELLTKISSYPENSVVVTGQPRYDFLTNIDKIYSKKKFMEKHSIPQNHKIITWLTQSHGLSEDENISNLNAVFETLKHMKNISLIIKQHPGEEDIHTKKIQEYLSKYNTNVIFVPKNSDTYELLFDSDVVITKDSTTGMEAVALNKPLIVLNLSGKPDLVEYVSEGVALGVYNKNDLKTTIEKLLKDDSNTAKNRKKYVDKYLYCIDGKATERVIEVIKNLTNNKRLTQMIT